MDNPSRSERTRKAVIRAALAIIARDGPGRLTLDAIARESGISKGGLTHQFRSKDAVLRALLEHQIERFGELAQKHMAEYAASHHPEPHLAVQIATLREALATPDPVAFAILGAMAEDPNLLAMTRERDAETVAAIKAEAADPDLATLRWLAAYGLGLSVLLGFCSLGEAERRRLFERLLDDRQWSAFAKAGEGAAGRGGGARRGRLRVKKTD